MAWWQITLILTASVIVGLVIGILLNYIIKRFIKKPFVSVRRSELTIAAQERRQFKEPTLTGEVGRAKATQAVEDRRHKKEPAGMVPLLSRQSIIVLVIGLLVGIGLGGGYWFISPTLAEIGESAQSSNLGQPSDGPHTSTISTRIVSKGSTASTLQDLRRQGEYYAVKMHGAPFFEFLSQELAEQESWYTHSPEELSEMVKIGYDWDSESPALKITATGASADEAVFLASIAAGVLNDYLVAEQESLRLEEYQSKMAQKETVKAALLEAEKKLANLRLQDGYDLNLNPDYTVLRAKLEALEAELAIRAGELARLVADGDTGHEYLDALAATRRTSSALSEVKIELSALEAGATLSYSEEKLAYSRAEAEVSSLNAQLDELDERLTYLAVANVESLILIGFETAGEPSVPTPVLVERIRGRNAVIMGAMLGLGCAWVILNRRWLASSISPFTVGTPEKNEEEEDEE